MNEHLAHLQLQYDVLLRRLSPHKPVSQFHQQVQTRPTHNGDAHVEVVDGLFHYVVTERGTELQRRVAQDEDEVLYWLIEDVTASISYLRRTSLLQRLLGRDPRRSKFRMQLRLLERVNPAWAERKKAHQDETLREYPFRDRR